MPRGIPKTGKRKPRADKGKRRAVGRVGKIEAPIVSVDDYVDTNESNAQILYRLHERFSVLEDLCDASLSGDARALIVSGPAGLGKSFTVEQKLAEWDPTETQYKIIKGYVKATGLFKLLYQFRHPGQVLVFDDADSLFYDDIALNFLKAVCDTTERRRVSYMSETSFVSEDGDVIPSQFDFNGTIIFITNLDFDLLINRGHKLKPHLEALVSRAYYLDLTLKTRRDFLVRINQVCDQGLLNSFELSESQHSEILQFIEDNANTLRELSLRVVIKLASVYKNNKMRWKTIAKTTLCRNH